MEETKMKNELFSQFEEELEGNTKEDLLKYIFDYFNFSELVRLLEHIKEENHG